MNDTVERNVKLIEEFNQKKNDQNEDQKQLLLKVCTCIKFLYVIKELKI